MTDSALSQETLDAIQELYASWREKSQRLIRYWQFTTTILCTLLLTGIVLQSERNLWWATVAFTLAAMITWIVCFRGLKSQGSLLRSLPLTGDLTYFERHRPVSNILPHAQRLFTLDLQPQVAFMVLAVTAMSLLVASELRASNGSGASLLLMSQGLMSVPMMLRMQSWETLDALATECSP